MYGEGEVIGGGSIKALGKGGVAGREFGEEGGKRGGRGGRNALKGGFSGFRIPSYRF